MLSDLSHTSKLSRDLGSKASNNCSGAKYLVKNAMKDSVILIIYNYFCDKTYVCFIAFALLKIFGYSYANIQITNVTATGYLCVYVAFVLVARTLITCTNFETKITLC